MHKSASERQDKHKLWKRGIKKPYIVTEYGVTGEWDVQTEKYGVKREPSDQEKYDAITLGYSEWIKKSELEEDLVTKVEDWVLLNWSGVVQNLQSKGFLSPLTPNNQSEL